MPSVPAQDPSVEPARITEGIQPLWMRRDDFYISRAMWSQFHSHFPWVRFEEFWNAKMRLYDYYNDDSKSFWEEFGCDLEEQASILSERCARRALRRAEASMTLPPRGLAEPKEEPAEETPMELCYRFRLRREPVEDDH